MKLTPWVRMMHTIKKVNRTLEEKICCLCMKVSVLKKDQDLNLFLRKNRKLTNKQGQKHVPEQDQEQVPEIGPGTIFVEEGQGMSQTGGTHAKSCLEQNKPNNLETVTRTNSRIGVETGPQTVPESGSPRNQAENDCG